MTSHGVITHPAPFGGRAARMATEERLQGRLVQVRGVLSIGSVAGVLHDLAQMGIPTTGDREVVQLVEQFGDGSHRVQRDVLAEPAVGA